MTQTELLELWGYIFNHMAHYERQVNEIQDSLRFAPVTVEDAVRLIQAQTRLETYRDTISDIISLLRL